MRVPWAEPGCRPALPVRMSFLRYHTGKDEISCGQLSHHPSKSTPFMASRRFARFHLVWSRGAFPKVPSSPLYHDQPRAREGKAVSRAPARLDLDWLGSPLALLRLEA